MEGERSSSSLSVRAEELVTTVLERAQRAVDSNPTPSSTSQTPDIDWGVCCSGGGRGAFDVELGRTLIWDYVRTPSPSWDVDPRWLLDVVFLDTTTTEEEEGEKEKEKEEKEDHTCTSTSLLHLHRYRARWSIPTRLAPIPRETASVYFFVVVRQGSKVGSPHQDQDHQDQDQDQQQTVLEVSYVVESTRSVHVVGRTRFREQMLRDVLESKALLRRAVLDF